MKTRLQIAAVMALVTSASYAAEFNLIEVGRSLGAKFASEGLPIHGISISEAYGKNALLGLAGLTDPRKQRVYNVRFESTLATTRMFGRCLALIDEIKGSTTVYNCTLKPASDILLRW
jgi:hypothetical protein